MISQPYIWITGASSGLGKAITKNFYLKNYSVFATARRQKELLSMKNELSVTGSGFLTYQSDISKLNDMRKSMDYLHQHGGSVECLINNAGISSFKKVEEDNLEDIQNIINTNLLGAIYAIKAVLPAMIQKKQGTIINMISVVTKKIFTQSSVYAASKSGLLAYTNVLREEVRKHNIRVINIFPGATATAIWSDEILNNHGSKMMKPEEVAEVIVQLYNTKNSVVPEELHLRPITGDL